VASWSGNIFQVVKIAVDWLMGAAFTSPRDKQKTEPTTMGKTGSREALGQASEPEGIKIAFYLF